MSETTASRLRALLLAGTTLGALPALSGCILAAAGAGAAGGYATLAQERSASDQVKDAAIRAQVSQAWDQYSPDLPHNLDATVYEGEVLITGRVASDQIRQEAVQRAWKVEGVKKVYNEVEVGADTHFSDEARDGVISTRLKNDLVWDKEVKSINYTIKTENGVVYVMGLARSKDELDRVTGYARNIPNVRRVISYARVREGEPARASNSPAAVQASSPAPVEVKAPPAAPTSLTAPADAPTQRTTIDVTPLR